MRSAPADRAQAVGDHEAGPAAAELLEALLNELLASRLSRLLVASSKDQDPRIGQQRPGQSPAAAAGRPEKPPRRARPTIVS